MKLTKISICLLSLIPIFLIGFFLIFGRDLLTPKSNSASENRFSTSSQNNNSKVNQPVFLPDNSEVSEGQNAQSENRQQQEEEDQEKEEGLNTNKNFVLHEGVPFTSQAPFGEWENPIFQDACEEAAVVMAMKWAQGKSLTSKEEAKAEIAALSDFQINHYGSYVDRSATSTARLIKDYYNHDKVEAYLNISAEDIKEQLFQENLVIVPVDGREVGNPHYTQPGPPRHMILIIGYDASDNEFITHDSGTQYGASYRYKTDVLENALRDYPSGDHRPITKQRTAMIVVESK